ncbi:hypothetical protein QYE76_029276 [Lolium multiflorum]|uniref:Transposase (putative) gypsy type domain-containing protein n=1 Tax=Lolium multiflorum TaxID=4521 RepID=A0AAD8QMI9_LOLMU|nr:hypothetical protein QYE76_029276 [Lolium multiflorum]
MLFLPVARCLLYPVPHPCSDDLFSASSSPVFFSNYEYAPPPATFSLGISAASDLRARVDLGKSVFRVDSSGFSLSSQQSEASDGLTADLARMETETGKDQEAGSSSQAPGVDLSGITRGAWKGSDVTQHEIDWLYRSRRIPEGVSCRLPGDEIEPVLEPGEYVVFLAHFERGFGLPASDFFRQVLDFYQLQPHHLPGNAVFYLSCYATFMEAYIGIRPTRETFARFFSLWINSVQGKDIPKPKPPVQCGSCIIGSRQGSPFFKFSGLESCRLWQGTFFYVKNAGEADLINLPAFNPAPPRKLMKETNICSDDIIRTFISRRVLPLKRRAHKMSEMYGPGDPTKITGLPLSKKDIVLMARQICQTAMPDDWEWGFLPLSSTNPPTEEAKDRFPRIEADRRGPCRKRPLDRVDPDPYIHWTDLKMGRTHTSRPDAPSASTQPQVHEHVAPLRAEAGDEFVEKLTPQGKKNKAPAPDAGSSQTPPAKRFRTGVLAGKEAGKRRYKGKQMPVTSGPALKLGPRPESSEGTARTSSPLHPSPAPSGAGNVSASPLGGTASSGRAAPTPPDHRAEEEHVSPPEKQDTGASNISADSEDAGRAEPLVPPVPKKKKKKTTWSSPSKLVSDSSAPDASSSPKTTPAPPPEAPSAKPTGATPTPPPETLKTTKGKATASGTSSAGPQQLTLHGGRAAVAAGGKPFVVLGRITELKREGRDLGHLLPYAEKWNAADVSAATRGLGKDRLPALDPSGPRCTEEHFMRLRRAVKELDNAWHDATNNMVSTADTRKHLFEELLWEHRDLAEAHSKCQGELLCLRHLFTGRFSFLVLITFCLPAIPEASIEALKTQLAALQAEKEQLIRQHREALDAQETYSKGLKDQLIQLGLKHNEAMKAAQAAAEAKLNEALEDANNSTVVLRVELEEGAKARKTSEDETARLKGEQKEYDLLVMQTDALALRLFPDSQAFAQKKVAERRVAQAYKNLDAPWDPYDHLVALSARVSHMRAVDRNLADIPEVAIQLFKVLWPEEEVPDNLSLTKDRLKGAGRRIREWQCSAARAGADSALRVACSCYPDLDLDALLGLRENAPTDTDPVLTAKRQDRAYRIAEYASVRTFSTRLWLKVLDAREVFPLSTRLWLARLFEANTRMNHGGIPKLRLFTLLDHIVSSSSLDP